MERIAHWHCGQVRLTCEGDPTIVIACHCQLCQRRTGSVIYVADWYERERVTFEGETNSFTRTTGDKGIPATFNFCPECGTSVWWSGQAGANRIGIGVGCFADPCFPPPNFSVYDKRRHPWVATPDGIPCYSELPDEAAMLSLVKTDDSQN